MIAAVTSDPAAWIMGASILGGCIGFFTCAIFVSRRILEAKEESYWEGYGACNREKTYGETKP